MKLLGLIFVLTGLGVSAQTDQFIKVSRDSSTILIKDTSDYSKEYINELLNWSLSSSYILNRDTLIINRGVEYGLFDTGLEKNRPYTFEGANKNLQITLIVKRINFSTLEYRIEIRKGEEYETLNGSAHGGVSIFGAESDQNDDTGVSYFCAEYCSNWKHPNITLRIDSEESNRAKVIINEGIGVTLSNCPTLKLKE